MGWESYEKGMGRVGWDRKDGRGCGWGRMGNRDENEGWE